MASFWEPEGVRRRDMAPSGGRHLFISAPSPGRCPPGRGAHPPGRAVPGAWRSRRRPSRRGAAEASGHRLGLIQRLGLGTEKLERARYDGVTLNCGPHRPLPRSRGQRGTLRVADRLLRPCRGPAGRPIRSAPGRPCASARRPSGGGARDRRVAGPARAPRAAVPGAPRNRGPGAHCRVGEAAVEALVVKLVGGDAGVDRGYGRHPRDAAAPSSRFRASSGCRLFCRCRCGAR